MSKTKTYIPTNTDSNLLALGRLGHLNLASNAAVRELRKNVKPGKYKGEVNLKLVYDMTVGEDHEAEVAASVPWKGIALALFSKLNGATRDKLVRELLTDDFTVDEGAISPEAEEAIKALMGSTRKTVAGKVTGNAVIMEQN